VLRIHNTLLNVPAYAHVRRFNVSTASRLLRGETMLKACPHPAACTPLAPINARHLKLLKPFSGCSKGISGNRKSFGRATLVQTQAVASTSQSTASKAKSSPAISQRPLKLEQQHRQDLRSNDTIADTGKPGQRVVIVGGGWAGESTLTCSSSAEVWLLDTSYLTLCTFLLPESHETQSCSHCRLWSSKAPVPARLFCHAA